MKRIGIDLGGTKIEGVVVDEALNVEHKLRLPNPRDRRLRRRRSASR